MGRPQSSFTLLRILQSHFLRHEVAPVSVNITHKKILPTYIFLRTSMRQKVLVSFLTRKQITYCRKYITAFFKRQMLSAVIQNLQQELTCCYSQVMVSLVSNIKAEKTAACCRFQNSDAWLQLACGFFTEIVHSNQRKEPGDFTASALLAYRCRSRGVQIDQALKLKALKLMAKDCGSL